MIRVVVELYCQNCRYFKPYVSDKGYTTFPEHDTIDFQKRQINFIDERRVQMKGDKMNEQVRIEEKAHFYTEKKDIVEKYSIEKEKQGYIVKVEPAQPKGWVVSSYIWVKLNN